MLNPSDLALARQELMTNGRLAIASAERRRDPKRQACLDGALDVVDKGLSRFLVRLQDGKR